MRCSKTFVIHLLCLFLVIQPGSLFGTWARGETTGCDLRARLLALMNAEKRSRPTVPSSALSPALRKRPRAESLKSLREHLEKNTALGERQMDRLARNLGRLPDSELSLAVEVVKGLPARRLESPLFESMLPSVIREMIGFHGPEGLDLRLAIQTLSEWDDRALAGLGRTYQLARKSLVKNASVEDRKEALEKALEKLTGKASKLEKEVDCADLGH